MLKQRLYKWLVGALHTEEMLGKRKTYHEKVHVSHILMVWDANLAGDEPAARDLNVGDVC